MQETAKCRRKRARVQAGGADTVIAQYFSGAAMQKDGGKRRFKRRHALRDQRANQAAEHIAAAAGRQSGMAGWIDRQMVMLDRIGIAAQQPRRFKRVWGQYGRVWMLRNARGEVFALRDQIERVR